VIQFREGATETQQEAARKRAKAKPKKKLRAAAAGEGALELATLPQGADPQAVADLLAGDPAVLFAEPNFIYTRPVVSAVSGDRGYTNGSLWGMYSNDSPTAVGPAGTTNAFGSQAEKAWAAGRTGGKGVYVGVIDTGIRTDHGDLAPNLWRNPGETGTDDAGRDRATNGTDDDGNGYVDDVHGYDFYGHDSSVYDGPADDHGTHVAGTIGARGNNTDWDGQCDCGGVVGVNWDVTMISAKFLGPDGGYLSDAVLAIDYLTALKTGPKKLNIVAINNSWTGGGYSQALLDAIVRAARANILFVAAAGNDASNNDAVISYPSGYNTTARVGYDSVIAVAAIDSAGARPGWSNYGRASVDLGAPGVGIWSTGASPAEWVNPYLELSGTSMATPHVTGAAALYASIYPTASARQIRTALLSTVARTSSLNGTTVTGGRLNIDAAIKYRPR
jgi:subtilisin family serine protease